MSQKTFNQVTAAVFGVGATVHLWRVVTGAPMAVGDWTVPVVASLVGALVAGFLSYTAYKLSK